MRWIERLARHPSTLPVRLARAMLLVLLAAAIVAAQSIGLAHRIEHAGPLGWMYGPLSAAGATQDAQAATLAEACGDVGHAAAKNRHDHGTAHEPLHDCAAIDALALGDGPPAAIAAVTEPPPAHPARLGEATSLREGSPASAFHARAPPTSS